MEDDHTFAHVHHQQLQDKVIQRRTEAQTNFTPSLALRKHHPTSPTLGIYAACVGIS